jgi:hypothetical protein
MAAVFLAFVISLDGTNIFSLGGPGIIVPNTYKFFVAFVVSMAVFTTAAIFVVEKYFKITIRVTDEGVSFLWRRQVYCNLPFALYKFDSSVTKSPDRILSMVNICYLIAICEEKEIERHYICHNFTKSTFDKIITDINSRNTQEDTL